VPADTDQSRSLLESDSSFALKSNTNAVLDGIAVTAVAPILPESVVRVLIERKDPARAYAKFWINDQETIEGTWALAEGKKYYLAVAMNAKDTEVVISSNVVPPPELDMLNIHATDNSNSSKWGYKFKVTPVYHSTDPAFFEKIIGDKMVDTWRNQFVAEHM
jgi:hypothetical protein